MNAIIDAQGRRTPPEPGALVFDVPASKSGVVVAIDNLRLARIARLTGAPQVAGAGVDLHARLGDMVHEGEPLYRLHARFDADLGFARRMAMQDSGYTVGGPGELPREFVGGGDLS
jgi:thymidine phosphorylase